MEKTARLPSARTTPEIRKMLDQACENLGIKYSTVVNQLVTQWLTGDIELKLELDPDFVASAKEALMQPESEELLGRVAKAYKDGIKDRTYPNATSLP